MPDLISYSVLWRHPIFLCFSIFPHFPWHRHSSHSIPPIFHLQWQHIYTQPFCIPRPSNFHMKVTPRYFKCFLYFSPLPLASNQTRHGRTSCPSNLIGYPTVPKHLSSLVLHPTHSTHYMLPALCLNYMIVEEGKIIPKRR